MPLRAASFSVQRLRRRRSRPSFQVDRDARNQRRIVLPGELLEGLEGNVNGGSALSEEGRLVNDADHRKRERMKAGNVERIAQVQTEPIGSDLIENGGVAAVGIKPLAV